MLWALNAATVLGSFLVSSGTHPLRGESQSSAHPGIATEADV